MSAKIPRKKAHLLSDDCIGNAENESFFAGEAKCTLHLSGGHQEQVSFKVYKHRIQTNSKVRYK